MKFEVKPMSITEALNPFGRSIRKYYLDTGTEYPPHLDKTVSRRLHAAMLWLSFWTFVGGFVLGTMI